MRTATFLWIGNSDLQRYNEISSDLQPQPPLKGMCGKGQLIIVALPLLRKVPPNDQHHTHQCAYTVRNSN